MLSTQGGSINPQNITWEPGAVYDSVLTLVQQPTPPVSFDEEINSNRSMAEQRVGIPDFGVGAPDQPQGNKTATETNVITNVMQQNNDLRARILKGSMSRVFEQAWSLLKQYDRASLDYFWRKQRISLDDAAFDNKYVLKPNGSVDGYSREREIQKLMQLRQMSQGAPWIVTPEIDRKIVELMDAQWVGDLYQEPQDLQADQQEQQAIENSVMSDGFLPQVNPNDGHLVHLQIEDGFIGWSAQNGKPIPPPRCRLFMQHMQMHIQAAKSNPQYWKSTRNRFNLLSRKWRRRSRRCRLKPRRSRQTRRDGESARRRPAWDGHRRAQSSRRASGNAARDADWRAGPANCARRSYRTLGCRRAGRRRCRLVLMAAEGLDER